MVYTATKLMRLVISYNIQMCVQQTTLGQGEDKKEGTTRIGSCMTRKTYRSLLTASPWNSVIVCSE